MSQIMQNPNATAPDGTLGPVHSASIGRVLLLVGTALLVLTQLYAAIPLAGSVGEQLGGSVTFALSTVYGLCYAVGFLIWGPLADRLGNKQVMVIGLAALVLLTVACAFATSVPVLAAFRGFQGFAAASFPPTALAYLAVATSPRTRATAIGAVSTSFLVSGILGQLFASAIAQGLGWSWVFIISAAALLVLTVVIALVIKEPRAPKSGGSVLAQFAASLRLVRRPTVLLLCAAHVTLLLSFVAMYGALGSHLSALGLDSSQTMLLRLVALPGMFATLLVGPLARRWSLAAIARAGVAIGAAGLLLEALLSANLIGTAGASLVFVAGISLAVSSMISLFGEASAPHRAGGMALNGFVLFLGASIGPLTSGLGLRFPILLIALAVLLILAAISLTGYAALRARPPNKPLTDHDHHRPGRTSMNDTAPTHKNALIIGAGPGLGAARARRFGREGFALTLIARNERNLSTESSADRRTPRFRISAWPFHSQKPLFEDNDSRQGFTTYCVQNVV